MWPLFTPFLFVRRLTEWHLRRADEDWFQHYLWGLITRCQVPFCWLWVAPQPLLSIRIRLSILSNLLSLCLRTLCVYVFVNLLTAIHLYIKIVIFRDYSNTVKTPNCELSVRTVNFTNKPLWILIISKRLFYKSGTKFYKLKRKFSFHSPKGWSGSRNLENLPGLKIKISGSRSICRAVKLKFHFQFVKFWINFGK